MDVVVVENNVGNSTDIGVHMTEDITIITIITIIIHEGIFLLVLPAFMIDPCCCLFITYINIFCEAMVADAAIGTDHDRR